MMLAQIFNFKKNLKKKVSRTFKTPLDRLKKMSLQLKKSKSRRTVGKFWSNQFGGKVDESEKEKCLSNLSWEKTQTIEKTKEIKILCYSLVPSEMKNVSIAILILSVQMFMKM